MPSPTSRNAGLSCGLPGPVGVVAAGVQGLRVLGAEDPLVHGQQRGAEVARAALAAGTLSGLPGLAVVTPGVSLGGNADLTV